jgi:hypothetical protein
MQGIALSLSHSLFSFLFLSLSPTIYPLLYLPPKFLSLPPSLTLSLSPSLPFSISPSIHFSLPTPSPPPLYPDFSLIPSPPSLSSLSNPLCLSLYIYQYFPTSLSPPLFSSLLVSLLSIPYSPPTSLPLYISLFYLSLNSPPLSLSLSIYSSLPIYLYLSTTLPPIYASDHYHTLSPSFFPSFPLFLSLSHCVHWRSGMSCLSVYYYFPRIKSMCM